MELSPYTVGYDPKIQADSVRFKLQCKIPTQCPLRTGKYPGVEYLYSSGIRSSGSSRGRTGVL